MHDKKAANGLEIGPVRVFGEVPDRRNGREVPAGTYTVYRCGSASCRSLHVAFNTMNASLRTPFGLAPIPHETIAWLNLTTRELRALITDLERVATAEEGREQQAKDVAAAALGIDQAADPRRGRYELLVEGERTMFELMLEVMPRGFMREMEPRTVEQWRQVADRFIATGLDGTAAFLSDQDPEVLGDEAARRGHQLCAIAFDFGTMVGAILQGFVTGEAGSATFRLEVLP